MRPDELEFRPENAHVVNHSGMTVLVAAKTMTGADGHTVEALAHDRLREVLKKYNRLAEAK